jgi:4-hydroxyphenylpyruvate dioxygenase
MTDVLTSHALTSDEFLAGLDAEQLRQLVGLVDYDEAADPFPVTGWDAVVWVVGNATQTAHFFVSAFGMELVGYAGPETGVKDHKAYVLRSGACRFVIKGGVSPAQPPPGPSPCARRRRDRHQPRGARRRPVRPARPGRRRPGGDRAARPDRRHGTVRLAGIAAYGDTVHTLVDRSRYDGVYLPGYVPRTSTYTKRPGAPKRIFQALDHVVGNVRLGEMDEWVAFYNRVMGFTNMAEFIGDDIAPTTRR